MNAPDLPLHAARTVIADCMSAGRLALPAVPRVVLRLIQQLRDESVSYGQLIAEVEQEPYIAARVLRMANSPFFGGRRCVSTIADAVPMIGTKALKTFVISGGLSAAFVSVPGVNLRDFWWHAQVTAAASRSFALPLGVDREAAYLVGLLHQVGHLIIRQAFEAELAACPDRVEPLGGPSLARLEMDCCGISHPEVGAYWMDSLGFPIDLVDAVSAQLSPLHASTPLGWVLALATGFSESVRMGQDLEPSWQRMIQTLTLLPEGDISASITEDLRAGCKILHSSLAATGVPA